MFRASLRSVSDPLREHVCISCLAQRLGGRTRLRLYSNTPYRANSSIEDASARVVSEGLSALDKVRSSPDHASGNFTVYFLSSFGRSHLATPLLYGVRTQTDVALTKRAHHRRKTGRADLLANVQSSITRDSITSSRLPMLARMAKLLPPELTMTLPHQPRMASHPRISQCILLARDQRKLPGRLERCLR